jgi:hypothetical protein
VGKKGESGREGKGEEMSQTMYAYVNKRIIIKKNVGANIQSITVAKI